MINGSDIFINRSSQLYCFFFYPSSTYLNNSFLRRSINKLCMVKFNFELRAEAGNIDTIESVSAFIKN